MTLRLPCPDCGREIAVSTRQGRFWPHSGSQPDPASRYGATTCPGSGALGFHIPNRRHDDALRQLPAGRQVVTVTPAGGVL